MVKLLAVIAISGLIAAGCSTTTTPARGQQVDALLGETLDAIFTFSERWDTTVAPLVDDLIDPDASYESVLALHTETLASLDSIAAEMHHSVAEAPLSERTLAQPIVNNYDDKLAALHDIEQATHTQDQARLEAALARFDDAVMRGLVLGCELMDRMRQEFGDAMVDGVLDAEFDDEDAAVMAQACALDARMRS